MDEKVIKVQVAVAMEDEKVVEVPSPLMVDNKVWPVTSMEIKKKKKKKMLLSVQVILSWAFRLACGVAAGILLSYIPIPWPCSQSESAWILFQCPDPTPAPDDDSFGDGFLWLAVPQGAAAAVGLLLPRRHARSRWCLALVAVVSATVAHCILARMCLIVIDAFPGEIGLIILCGASVVVYLAGDLISLISLLIGGPE